MTTDDFQTLIKKHPIGFGSGLLCIICGVLLYIRYDNISARQIELEAVSSEAKTMTTNVRNMADLPEQLAKMQAMSKELEGRLIQANQLALNLQYFYKLEADHQVKFSTVRQDTVPLSNTAKPLFVAVPYTITAVGSYKNLMGLLNQTEHGRSFCRVNSAVFSKSATEPNATDSNMSLALNIDILGQP